MNPKEDQKTRTHKNAVGIYTAKEAKTMKKYTASKRQYTAENADAWAEALIIEADTYEEASRAAREYLDEHQRKRVAFVQSWTEGGEPRSLSKQYTIRQRPKAEREALRLDREIDERAEFLNSEDERKRIAAKEAEEQRPAHIRAAEAWNKAKAHKAKAAAAKTEAEKREAKASARGLKLYAIRAAREAIAQGMAEELPEDLRRKAAAANPEREAKPRKIYRVAIIGEHGLIKHKDHRKRKSAERALAFWEATPKAKGAKPTIEEMEAEPEATAALEAVALDYTEQATEAKRRNYANRPRQLLDAAAAAWRKYIEAGGNHAAPEGLRERISEDEQGH